MRIGVIGYGASGHWFHVPFIQAVPELELVGVVTRSDARRAPLATEAQAFLRSTRSTR